MKVELSEKFKTLFNKDPEHLFFCPGRVNLIGEHIDYNGGKVMPCAISLGTCLAVAKNNDNILRFRCINFPETADIPIQIAYSKTGKEWFNYPLGVINYFVTSEDESLAGMDMLYYGNLPIGAGLSSSASIEVLTAFALDNIFHWNNDGKSIALLSQKVENEFIGVSCGIMDQFAVTMGKKDKAILLDCDTLNYEYLPVNTDGYTLTIINSNKQRALAESKYNERFSQCNQALSLLNKELDIKNLCDIDPATLDKYSYLISDPVLLRRARHVVSENARVNAARDALKAAKLSVFGELLYASHQSLKELYEVSGKELDAIVDFCKTYDGCIGARMTGAGFGGCAIALVKKERLDDFSQKLRAYYQERIGYFPDVFASDIGDGVREI